MSRELYFLRSSEQKIVKDMTKLAYPHAEGDLEVYYDFFGLTSKDLGLYALVNNEIAGAVWTRELDGNTTPTMSFALLPKFKKQGIGIFMMEQFLQEAGAIYEEIQIDISHKPKAIKFYEKFGFQENPKNIMSKKLERKEVFRPSDGYDPTRWMD
ncbi:MAG: GNAT family N-acetyltransferase [Sulfurimonas sp.]|nr:GNAT family N-acetyltransferase [Sulfurimonas sp.]